MGMQASMIDSCVRGYQGTRTGYLLIEHSIGSKNRVGWVEVGRGYTCARHNHNGENHS